jgi:RimJ/RimL family protein N-acetyltransferase
LRFSLERLLPFSHEQLSQGDRKESLNPNPAAKAIVPVRLLFGRFDERFLERSWEWLSDPEIKRLTMTPDFTREEQLRWFERLPEMPDYRIWGISYDTVPIGALGLKHITQHEAEYWGYIGERSYWNAGLGGEMMRFIFARARELKLGRVYLNVHSDNARAVQLYTNVGFKIAREQDGVLQLEILLRDPACNDPEKFLVDRYTPERRRDWDRFLMSAKNATFLFNRGYMDYHSDRFADHSLMVSRGQELLALLPANRSKDGTLVSHEGLTYGGLVVSRDATLNDVLESFHACLRYLHEEGITRLLYKRIPSFYNTIPDDEVAYALFLLEARLYRRDCALVVNRADRLRFRKGRKSEISKARRFGVRVVQEPSFDAFWEKVLVPRLESRYGVKPVHSIDEIKLLASRFPENIRQFSAYRGEEIVAGTTIYETPGVAHAQYIAVTDEGQKIGALDFLFGWLIDEHYQGKNHFDLGICNEKGGRALNEGLLDWKEGFGGRSYAHDFYEVPTANHTKLESLLSEPDGDDGPGLNK